LSVNRVGVRATTHALRRAFAVAFLTSHPGAIEALQALLNHSRIDTTQVYLRALNRSKAMEAVRDLSWGLGFQPDAEEAHTGFGHPWKSGVSYLRGRWGGRRSTPPLPPRMREALSVRKAHADPVGATERV
jgi:hypothetical protein